MTAYVAYVRVCCAPVTYLPGHVRRRAEFALWTSGLEQWLGSLSEELDNLNTPSLQAIFKREGGAEAVEVAIGEGAPVWPALQRARSHARLAQQHAANGVPGSSSSHAVGTEAGAEAEAGSEVEAEAEAEAEAEVSFSSSLSITLA